MMEVAGVKEVANFEAASKGKRFPKREAPEVDEYLESFHCSVVRRH
jgi:hypothetical protein